MQLSLQYRLPPEILSRIFLEYRKLHPLSPAIISHVCKSWRQAALSYSQLWNRIELSGNRGALHRASQWAQRAGRSPLHIIIRYRSNDDYDMLLSWLLTSARRIKTMAIIHLSSHSNYNQLLKFIPSLMLDLMEAFQILGVEDVFLDCELIAKMLYNCPRLSSISMAGVEGLPTGSCRALLGTTSRLTHLSIGARSYIDYVSPLRVDAIVDILTHCPSLLSLECHAVADPDDREPPIVYLPSLRSLLIGDGPESCQLLLYLNTPRLSTLCVSHGKILNHDEEEVEIPSMDHDRQEYSKNFVDTLRCLYATCSPPIKEIVWERCIVNVNILNDCAPFLPSLEILDIYEQEGVSLDFLSSSVNGIHTLFPCLREIILTNCVMNPQLFNSVQLLLEEKQENPQRTLPHVIVRDC